MSTEAIAGTLESDLRLLSSEARRADGLASQLTGWLSGPEHPQIKEAAERAILRLRSFSAREDGLEHLRNSKVVRLATQLEEHLAATWLTTETLHAGCPSPFCYGNGVKEFQAHLPITGQRPETGCCRCDCTRWAVGDHTGHGAGTRWHTRHLLHLQSSMG